MKISSEILKFQNLLHLTSSKFNLLDMNSQPFIAILNSE
jgi:hypothetical protein